ncbi:hypothetical protein GCM10023322_75270 [Rugosimonospora acidiphila]|uniref:Carboxypeptidase regulatory-like domain-containing protein n=1 Tax=Rugosimonospora acidiphila TaxID=556531 RepID=A0ABP9SN37_9ACTN
MSDPPRPPPLAEELAEVLSRHDPVPPTLLDAASATLRWREADARLAALIDEENRALAAPAVRGAPPRLLSFEVDAVTIDLELSTDDGRARLIGQIAPTAAMPVEVRHANGVWAGRTDELGRFAVADLPCGPMRVSCTPDTASGPVTTAVFTA